MGGVSIYSPLPCSSGAFWFFFCSDLIYTKFIQGFSSW